MYFAGGHNSTYNTEHAGYQCIPSQFQIYHLLPGICLRQLYSRLLPVGYLLVNGFLEHVPHGWLYSGVSPASFLPVGSIPWSSKGRYMVKSVGELTQGLIQHLVSHGCVLFYVVWILVMGLFLGHSISSLAVLAAPYIWYPYIL